MHIVHVTAEMTPIAKVGGLGDVVLGLGRELAARGHRLDIILPKYDCLETSQVSDLTVALDPLVTHYDGRRFYSSVWQGWVEGLKVYFIEAPAVLSFFNRGTIYGCADDIERFLYFSRAALELLVQKGIHPQVLHLHDWQTAFVPAMLRNSYSELGLNARTVYTIHNIEYQGHCDPSQLAHIGIDGNSYLTQDALADDHKPEMLNLMKGGIVYADLVNTVSPTYAKELLKPGGGWGLEAALQKHQSKFSGILNGLDYTFWNPYSDRYVQRYCTTQPPVSLRTDTTKTGGIKSEARTALRDKLGLAHEHRPIVCSVSRLVHQKGPHLIKHALRRTLEKGGQFVLLGSSPTSDIAADFEAFKAELKGNPHVSMNLRSSEELAHLIFAGADITVVPSLFEPCGLTQLIALRYGTIPVVRRTGGLADTIFDVDVSGLPFEQTNGYTFDFPDAEGVNWALDRALSCWFDQPDRWHQLMTQAMSMDYSWNRSVDAYLRLYEKGTF